MEFQEATNSQIVLVKTNKDGGLTLPDFKTYCKATVIKVVQCLQKNRLIDQCNRIENPENKPKYLWSTDFQ